MAEKSRAESQRVRHRAAPVSGQVAGPVGGGEETTLAADLQRAVGNQAVQRLLSEGANLPDVIQSTQRPLGNQAIQRLVSTVIQRSLVGPEATEDLGQSIRAESGHGQSLEPSVRQSLEGGLGADLSSVRIHTDAKADHLSRAVNAVAFTSGSDIFFRSGTFSSGSASGMHLLAHEATHVAQQAAGPVAGTPAPGGVSISDPSDSFEQAAEQTAQQVTQRMSLDSASSASAEGSRPSLLDDERNATR